MIEENYYESGLDGGLNLEMRCAECGCEVWRENGDWMCECISIPEYLLDEGFIETPDSWKQIEEKGTPTK